MSEHMTESEMRAFFERLISSFVAASDTHKKLEALTVSHEETQRRVTEVTASNSQLKQELYTTVSERDKARAEASDNKALADIYRSERDKHTSEAQSLRTRAADLQIELDLASGEHERVIGERDMWRTTAEHSTADRDYWRNRALENETNYKKLEESYAELKEKHAKLGSFFKEMFDEGPAKLEHKGEERPLASTTQEQAVGQGEPTSEYPSSNQSPVSTSEAIDPLPHFTPPGYEPPGSSTSDHSTSEQSTQETGPGEQSPSQESSPGEIPHKLSGWNWNFEKHEYSWYVDGEVRTNFDDEYMPDGRKNPHYLAF